MGPGGLDPVEVFESLPEVPIEEAKYHMKRCEDSGLWVSEK
jgi:cell division cycle protein 37